MAVRKYFTLGKTQINLVFSSLIRTFAHINYVKTA